jgi:diaminohydroxyphosphoribosylaminopyrimidine deaminase/5-amino-6-(5-phosphoribosylamino)uracil reductase
MNSNERDVSAMRTALALAQQNTALARPNPSVGCVIVRDGEVIATGATQAYGCDHAEQAALKAAGERARGATMFVTLEPCCAVGTNSARSEPCTGSILRAGVARVVVATIDTNPNMNGQGIAALRAAGVHVDVGICEDECIAHHIGFLTRMARGTPWVRAKIASSLDGRTALANGTSQWMTGEPARADGHAFRARACAVLAGSGTVRVDNPQLTVRHVAANAQPLRVVLNHADTLTPDLKIFQTASAAAPVLVINAVQKPPFHPHVEMVALPDVHGRIDLHAVMHELGRRHVNELHLEAGARLTGAFIEAGLVDELLVYVAPMILGPQAKEMFTTKVLNALPTTREWDFFETSMVGADLRLRLRRVNAPTLRPATA